MLKKKRGGKGQATNKFCENTRRVETAIINSVIKRGIADYVSLLALPPAAPRLVFNLCHC